MASNVIDAINGHYSIENRGNHVVTTQLAKNEYVTVECTLLRRRNNVNYPQTSVSELCEISYFHF